MATLSNSYCTGARDLWQLDELTPGAKPEDKVCLRSHNSLVTSQSLIYLLLEVIGAMQCESNHHSYVFLFLATRRESEETCAYSS